MTQAGSPSFRNLILLRRHFGLPVRMSTLQGLTAVQKVYNPVPEIHSSHYRICFRFRPAHQTCATASIVPSEQ